MSLPKPLPEISKNITDTLVVGCLIINLSFQTRHP